MFNYYLEDQVTREICYDCHLKEVFRNGTLLVDYSLAQVRESINAAVNNHLK